MRRKSIGISAALFTILAWAVTQANEADLYAKHCKKCHADDGSGKKPTGEWMPVAKSLKLEKPEALSIVSAEAKALTDEEIVKSMIEGKGKMKSMKDKVTADEAKSLAAYVRQLQAKAK